MNFIDAAGMILLGIMGIGVLSFFGFMIFTVLIFGEDGGN